MESERSLLSGFNPNIIPVGLLALALVFGLLSLAVGWFAVTTRIQVWEYDSTQPDGKGDYTGASVRIHNEFRPLEMSTSINPTSMQTQLEQLSDLPSYEAQMDKTGSKMFGIFLVDLVAFFSLAGVTGFYWWHWKGRRDLSRSVWRFAALFAVFALFSLVYLYAQVPAAAQQDTREVLTDYDTYLQTAGLPPGLDRFMRPHIQFWNTWICCPPDSVVPYNGREFLVQVTTESRPSAGFWLMGADVSLVCVALVMGTRAGQLAPKTADVSSSTEPRPQFKAA